jgi:hypothetical protein
MSNRYTCSASIQVDFVDGTVLECEATLEGQGSYDDLGVPHSPEWLTIDEIDVVYPISIDGVDYLSRAAIDAMAFPGFHVTLENQFLSHDWEGWECADDWDWHEGDIV